MVKYYGNDKTEKIINISGMYPAVKTPTDLYILLQDIWCKYTCTERLQNNWSTDNKALGQCSITAFLAQDIFGGKVYGMKRSGGNMHCYNVVDGVTFDLTSEQFGDEAVKLVYDTETDEIQDRDSEKHLKLETKRRRYNYLTKELQRIAQLGIKGDGGIL